VYVYVYRFAVYVYVSGPSWRTSETVSAFPSGPGKPPAEGAVAFSTGLSGQG